MFALDWTNEDFFVPGSSCYKWGVFHYSSSLCGIRLHDYYRMVSKLRVGLPTPCMLADEETHTCTVGEHSQPLSQPLTPYRRPLNLKLRLEMVQQLRALPILPEPTWKLTTFCNSFSGLLVYTTCKWYTDIHLGKLFVHIK